MTVDIVQLIETNPITDLTKPYQSKLVNKIKHQFSSDEQHLFVASFYCYLNYKPTEFIIDLDTIWEWLGFARKDPAKRLLIQNFEENIDFRLLHRTVENSLGRPSEQILMTQKTFKKLCMKSGTKKADMIHDYFIGLEGILQETLLEESNELRDQLQQKDIILKSTEIALESEKEKLKKMMRKRHYDSEPGQTVYVYKNDVNDPSSKIRIGKSENIKNRELAYNHSNINGEIVYAKRCYNCELMEKVCHHILDKYRIYPDQEWFDISDTIAIQVVNMVHLFMDEFIPYTDLLDTVDIFSKFNDSVSPSGVDSNVL